MMRVVIVDDEKPALAKLRRWLESEPGIDIMGEFADGLSAAHWIMMNSADALFLDVQMPGLSGLQVAAQLQPESAPLVVFVTAYDVHALRAFDLNAVDYLLKPFDQERFHRALERVRDRFNAPERGRAAVQAARAQTGVTNRLLVPSGNELRLIDCSSIHSFEADDNHVHVHTANQRYVLRRTLGDVLAQVGGQHFIRIHKSSAVNIAEIDALSPLFKGDYELRLRSGRTLRLSRRYTADLFHRTGR